MFTFYYISVMCSSNKVEDEEYIQLKKRTEKRNQERFAHLYKEKFYYISKKDNQTLTTGYKPDDKGNFKFCVRLNDFQYNDFLTLTLFQYVCLIKDLRNIIYSEEQNKIFDEIDGSMRFSFKDINVPKVEIQIDATYSIPNLFELILKGYKKQESSSIVVDRKTAQGIIETENEIINTIETLEDIPTDFLFHSYILNCAEHLLQKKTEIDSNKIYHEIKAIRKTSFQSEIFLKFWPLMYKLIESQLIKGELDQNYTVVD